MWDEKKFYRDFSEAMDQVKQDAEFVKKLKAKTSKEAFARRNTAWVKYGAAAAVVLLCITGAFTWNQTAALEQPEVQMENSVQAGKEDASGTDSETIITLKMAKECLENEETLVTDGNGSSIDAEKRAELIDLLEQAVSTEEQPEEDAEYQEYHCSGDSEFSLIVYENGYFEIAETGIMYKSN